MPSISIIATIAVGSLSAQAKSSADRFAGLDALTKAGATVSAIALNGDGSILASRNPDTRVMPASNQKIFSCAFALDRLGPSYRPETRFWKEDGAIIVDAPGDPTMSYADLVRVRTELMIAPGSPICVNQGYRPGWPDSWLLNYLPNRYGAPISAFSYDQGAFALWAKDGQFLIRPPNPLIRFVTTPGEGKLIVQYDPASHTVYARGKVPVEETAVDTLSFGAPDAAAAAILGGTLAVAKPLPSRPADSTLIGRSVGDDVAACIPASDNLMAENLMMMASGARGGVASHPAAATAMEAWVRRSLSIEDGGYAAEDGSGLSRRNIVTARTVSRLYRWARSRPWYPTFRSSLAVSGHKGTLANRLKAVAFAGKTGSLSMVAALSGLLTRKDGSEITVVVIVNHFAGDASRVRAVMDGAVQRCAL